MPRGIFVPLENPIRFYARPRSFTLECPYCGKLLFIGKGERDAKCFNRVTSVISCPAFPHKATPGCGRKFLVGIVAWPMRLGPQPKATRPEDQIPEEEQVAELRAFALGRFARGQGKKRGESVNQIEPAIDPATLKE